jgi:hypothetical protein
MLLGLSLIQQGTRGIERRFIAVAAVVGADDEVITTLSLLFP